jgi:hypothetical protein
MAHPTITVQGLGGATFEVDDFRDPNNPSPGGPIRDEAMRCLAAKGELAVVDTPARKTTSKG